MYKALLVKCEAMSSLLLSMDRFYEQDMKKKIAAAQVISRYFKEKLKGRFQWPRYVYVYTYKTIYIYFHDDVIHRTDTYHVYPLYFCLCVFIRIERFMYNHDKTEQNKLKEKNDSRRKLVATQKHLLSMATNEMGMYVCINIS